jgi:superfamily II DNA or RNA helicase
MLTVTQFPLISEMKIRTKLMAHQEAAVAKLNGLRVGGLFMEMGTGKSLTLLELCYQRKHKIDKVVYFCPVNLKATAAYEIQIVTRSPVRSTTKPP